MSINLNKEHLEPIVSATMQIMKQVCSTDCVVGKLYVKNEPYGKSRLITIIGLTGDFKGQVFFSMDLSTAYKIASTMMGMEVSTLDEISSSAIQELTNMILGTTSTIFFNKGIKIDITPPSIVSGDNIKVTSKMQSMCIPINLVNIENSIIEIDVLLKDN